jgi:hypothetical protein
MGTSLNSLVSKVYFPRLIIPAGTVITSLVDLLISAALLALLTTKLLLASASELAKKLPGQHRGENKNLTWNAIGRHLGDSTKDNRKNDHGQQRAVSPKRSINRPRHEIINHGAKGKVCRQRKWGFRTAAAPDRVIGSIRSESET